MGSFIDSFDPLKGLNQSPSAPSSPGGGVGSGVLSSLMGAATGLPPLSLQASSSAKSSAQSGNISSDFRSGNFSVGGSGGTNLNVLILVAGVIALAFLLFNRRGKR